MGWGAALKVVAKAVGTALKGAAKKGAQAVGKAAKALGKPQNIKGATAATKMGGSLGQSIQGTQELQQLVQTIIDATGIMNLFTGIIQLFLGQLGIFGKEVIEGWMPHIRNLLSWMQSLNSAFKAAGQVFAAFTLFIGNVLGTGIEAALTKTRPLINMLALLLGTFRALSLLVESLNVRFQLLKDSIKSVLDVISGEGGTISLNPIVNLLSSSGGEGEEMETAQEGGIFSKSKGIKIHSQEEIEVKRADLVGEEERLLSSILDELQLSRKQRTIDTKFQKRRRF